MAKERLISSKLSLLGFVLVFYGLLVVLLIAIVGPLHAGILRTSLLLSPLFILFTFTCLYLFEFIYVDETSFRKGINPRRVSFSDIDTVIYYGVRGRGFLDFVLLFNLDKCTPVSLMFVPDKQVFFEKLPWASFHESTKGIVQKRPVTDIGTREDSKKLSKSDHGALLTAIVVLIGILWSELYLFGSDRSMFNQVLLVKIVIAVFVAHLLLSVVVCSRRIFIEKNKVTIRTLFSEYTASVDAFLEGRKTGFNMYRVKVEGRHIPLLVPYSFFKFVQKARDYIDQE